VDIVARLLARSSSKSWPPFVVENKSAAHDRAAMLAKSPGDGYTLMMMHQGLAFNASLYSDLPYDTLRDLAPIAHVGATPNALVVTDALPVKTVQEFLAYARSNPAASPTAPAESAARGISRRLLQSLTGTSSRTCRTRIGPAITDLISGQIQAMLLTMPAVMPYIKGGKVRAIATSGARRSPALPDLPTIAEAGGPLRIHAVVWNVRPGHASEERIARLNSAVNKALRRRAREKLAQQVWKCNR